MGLFKKKKEAKEVIWSGFDDGGAFKRTKANGSPGPAAEPQTTTPSNDLGFLGAFAASATQSTTEDNDKLERLDKRLDRFIERIELLERKIERVENKMDLKY